ncbi:hypothetical protein McanCB56680_004143 [Microsporum canis]
MSTISGMTDSSSEDSEGEHMDIKIDPNTWRDITRLARLLKISKEEYREWVAGSMYKPAWDEFRADAILPAAREAEKPGS